MTAEHGPTLFAALYPLADPADDRAATSRYRIFATYDRCIAPTPDIAGRSPE